jgi:hypothetical protein
MSNSEWKSGFEAGIDFVLTLVNEHAGYEFKQIHEVAAELKHLQNIVKIFEEHTKVKVKS